LQYLGDLDPVHSVLPAAGTIARYEVIGVLSYIGTEYHKTVQNLFNPTLPTEIRSYFHAGANAKLSYIDTYLLGNGKNFLVGSTVSVADIYLYICLTWSRFIDLDLDMYPNITAFYSRISNLEAVKLAMDRMVTKPTYSC
jgi:glutathione S-transferase